MKKLFPPIFSVIILLAAAPQAFPCTSFAIYSDGIWYGMNFDYPPTELRFVVHPLKDMKLFAMEFKQGNNFLRTAAMNDRGLFAAMQLQYPALPAKASRGENEIFVWQLESTITRFSRTEEAVDYVKDKRLVPFDPSIHCLFADPTGRTMIAEPGERENGIVLSREKFAVMTNFKHSDFTGRPYTEVSGIGADRYITAHEYLSAHRNKFDLGSGWDLLIRTTQGGSAYPTLCSMMFDPRRSEVYIVLNRDFSRVWKISIKNNTIMLFKGFSKQKEMKLPAQGILASEMTALAVEGKEGKETAESRSKVSSNKTNTPKREEKGEVKYSGRVIIALPPSLSTFPSLIRFHPASSVVPLFGIQAPPD